MKEKKKLSLATKTFIGFGLGIVIGLVFGEKATIVKPLGTIFLNMIKMIVVPMVFFSITAGVASLGDLKKLRNIGVKVVGLYALTSALCVGLGLIMANIINPGKGFDLTALSQSTDYEAQAMPSIIDTLIDMFPSNIFTSFTNTNMLQIIVFSVFLGVALIMMGKEGERLLAGVQGCANAMYKITAIVMEFSPIGVCTVSRFSWCIWSENLWTARKAYSHGLCFRCNPCFTDVYSDGSVSGKVPGKEMAAGYLESMGCNGQHHQQQRFSSDHNLCYE